MKSKCPPDLSQSEKTLLATSGSDCKELRATVPGDTTLRRRSGQALRRRSGRALSKFLRCGETADFVRQRPSACACFQATAAEHDRRFASTVMGTSQCGQVLRSS